MISKCILVSITKESIGVLTLKVESYTETLTIKNQTLSCFIRTQKLSH